MVFGLDGPYSSSISNGQQIVVRIAVFTATDRELCNFQTICPRTYAVIAEPRASIWRTKYIQTYDLCRQVVITNAELKKEYQTRQRVVAGSRHVRIRDGYMPKEQIIVELLKILITGTHCCNSPNRSYLE